MRRIDDILVEKICDILNFALSKAVKPDITMENVRVLNKGMIRYLKEKYGIEGVILDVDETLRRETRNIPRCNQDWIESLRGELKVVILSNGWSEKVEKYFAERGIDYIKFGFKPLRRNFLKACKSMDVDPDKVLVIGNDLWSDIHGGKKNNMRTALVKKVQEDER